MSNNQTKSTNQVDLDNSRLDEQREVMRQILADESCPFCLENIRKYHKQVISKDGKYWMLTPNQWPYKHTKVHFLAIYKKHAETLSEIDPESGNELLEMMQWVQKEYQVPGGGWAMRFGDTNYSGGTVNHIHVQFVQPDLDDPEYVPVRIKLGKNPELLEKNK